MRSSPNRICGFMASLSGDDVRALQVDELRRHRRRSDVRPPSRRASLDAGVDFEQRVVVAHGGGDLVVAALQRFLDGAVDGEIDRTDMNIPSAAQRIEKAFAVA